MKKGEERKPAILIVAFGTSIPAAAGAFDDIERLVRERHAGTEVRWAYTSTTIRSRSAALGKPIDSPETALSRLMAENYTHIAVFSLHVVPGKEFHDLYGNAMRFTEMRGGFERLIVARPLLGNYDDMSKVADALFSKFAVSDPGEGVVFIGHGNRRHPSDAIYVAMDSLVRDLSPNLFVGTVQGHPAPDAIALKIKAAKIRKVLLVPLMTVAGDHVGKDMAGDAPGSWKSILSSRGIQSETVLSGLCQYPEIVEIWMEHLAEAVAELKRPEGSGLRS